METAAAYGGVGGAVGEGGVHWGMIPNPVKHGTWFAGVKGPL